jgi:hypothetical protein
VDAQTFLSTAQARLDDFREARKKHKAAGVAKAAAKAAYDLYCSVQETELNALYDAVQEDFSMYCYSLYDLLEARNKLDAAVREFVRRAGPWAVAREPRKKKPQPPAESPAVQPEEV